MVREVTGRKYLGFLQASGLSIVAIFERRLETTRKIFTLYLQ